MGETESSDGLEGPASTYPLSWRITQDYRRLPDPAEPTDLWTYVSAAAAIAKEAAGIDLGEEAAHMAQVWGPLAGRRGHFSRWSVPAGRSDEITDPEGRQE